MKTVIANCVNAETLTKQFASSKTHQMRLAISSKKGFFLVSPFMGIFFFLITVGITASFVSTNDQAIKTAKAGQESELVFVSYAIQADAFDVYLQNSLQSFLDNYNPGTGGVFLTNLTYQVTSALSGSGSDPPPITTTYKRIYENQNLSGITCNVTEASYSGVYPVFLSSSPKVLGCTHLPTPLITDTGVMVINPMLSRYGMLCSAKEPPIEIGISLNSRWYYLDASNICLLAPSACTPC